MSIVKIENQFIDIESGISGFISADKIVYLNLKGRFITKEDFIDAPHIHGFAMTSLEGISKISDIYEKSVLFFSGGSDIPIISTSEDSIDNIEGENIKSVDDGITEVPVKTRKRRTSKK